MHLLFSFVLHDEILHYLRVLQVGYLIFFLNTAERVNLNISSLPT